MEVARMHKCLSQASSNQFAFEKHVSVILNQGFGLSLDWIIKISIILGILNLYLFKYFQKTDKII